MKTLALAAAGLALLALANPARADESIKVGTGPVTASGPLYIALERGYFAAEHLTAEMVSMDAAQSVAQGVVSGALDIGATAATAAAYNLAAKGGLKIIGGQGREMPGFHGAAVLVSNQAWDGGLRSLKDLAGRNIAIVQIGGPIHYELELVNEKYGIDPKSQRLSALQGLSNVATALAGNNIEAGINVSTFALKLQDTGKAHILAWVGDETPWQNTLIFVATKTADERKPMIDAFMRAYKKAAHDYDAAFTGPDGKRKDGPTAPAILAIMAKFTGVPAAEIEKAIPSIDPEGRLDEQSVADQIAWYKSQGLLKGDADAAKLIDHRYAILKVAGK